MCAKRSRICHFYAEIAKFGLILTHLKLFRGKRGGGGKKIIFGGGGQMPNASMPPCGTATEGNVHMNEVLYPKSFEIFTNIISV